MSTTQNTYKRCRSRPAASETATDKGPAILVGAEIHVGAVIVPVDVPSIVEGGRHGYPPAFETPLSMDGGRLADEDLGPPPHLLYLRSRHGMDFSWHPYPFPVFLNCLIFWGFDHKKFQHCQHLKLFYSQVTYINRNHRMLIASWTLTVVYRFD